MGDLFDSLRFVPRGQCGGWDSELVALSQISDAIIALCYFLIPVLLFVLWLSKRPHREDFKVNWIILCFCTFILLCGATHLCDVLAFHWPAYRFFVVISFFTAMMSGITVVLLPWVVIKLSGSPSLRALIGEIESVRCAAIRQDIELRIERLVRADVENQLAVERIRCASLQKSLEELRLDRNQETVLLLDEAKEGLNKLKGMEREQK